MNHAKAVMPGTIAALDRLRSRTTEYKGCWQWEGATNGRGYGMVHLGSDRDGTRRKLLVHRVGYEILRAEIPDGLHLDHLCRNRLCWNPWHLEPVTARVNNMRGFSPSAFHATKTHCPRGHEYTEANTYRAPSQPSSRCCRACGRIRESLRAPRPRKR